MGHRVGVLFVANFFWLSSYSDQRMFFAYIYGQETAFCEWKNQFYMKHIGSKRGYWGSERET